MASKKMKGRHHVVIIMMSPFKILSNNIAVGTKITSYTYKKTQ